MQRSVRLLFILCLAITVGIVGLQAIWLRNYYMLNKDRFEKDVNLALEDALKKEFGKRNDSIEGLLFHFLMDTANIRITSRRSEKDDRRMMYEIRNAANVKDYYSFSRKELDFPLTSQQDANKTAVALVAARLDREEDLDHHIIFYRTQNVGRYLQDIGNELSFDTSRLRPFLKEALRLRDVSEPFVFALRHEDSTLNKTRFSDSLTNQYPVITKAFPTYKNEQGENFVRACFPSPARYLLSKTIGLVIGSAVLLVIVSLAFLYLLKIIRREKKLLAVKNDFINHITHEFKTPIATVYSAVQALDDFNALADPVKSKRYLQLSKRELERLSELVTKVLHISLYERPQFEMKVEEIELETVITDVLQAHRETLPQTALINYENRASSSTVVGDAVHLYNGINNLIDNAIKYSTQPLHIDVCLSAKDGWLELSVKDNGCGIKKEHLEFVFDKFYRVPQQREVAAKGFGLGLSYLKQIVEKHKGRCRVESEWGKGSIFTIRLPQAHDK